MECARGCSNVGIRIPCKTTLHLIVVFALFSFSKGDKLGKYFSKASCELDPTWLLQNEGQNQTHNANSTFELRRKCESIHHSCTCDSPQQIRCHNPAIKDLNIIIKNIAESIGLDIKMLDWNLPGIEVFTKKVFRNQNQKPYDNLHLMGLFISSNGTLRRLEDGSLLGLRKELQVLGLSDNNLGPDIPKEIFSIPNLARLDVSKNNISNLHPILSRSRSLRYLDLSNNHLQSIHKQKTNLLPDSLCTLKVAYNQITLEGLSGTNLVQIGLLDLSHNNLTGNLTRDIFGGRGGEKIETLYLDNNQLHYIGENSFHGLPKLKHLWLSHNNIDRLDRNSFVGLKDLSYIDLSHNQILDITRGLFEPLSKSLTKLVLSDNHLSVLYSPITAVPLSSLTYLDLQNNEIIKIEGNSFESLSSLKSLLLAGNIGLIFILI